jgi:hypothetical protein
MPPVTPTTGKFSSSKILFLVDGFNLLGAKIQNLRHKVGVLTEPTHGVGDSWPEHSPTGTRFAELVQEGAFFNTSTGNSHAALADASAEPMDSARVACAGFAGNVAGQPFTGYEGALQGEYEVLDQVGALVRANAAWMITGKAEDGVIIHALAAETADGNSEGASVDNSTSPQITIPITSSSVANPSLITTPVPHGLATGDTVIITGHSGSTPSIDGERTVTVVSTTTFSIPVNVTIGGTGGTFVRGKTNAGATGYLQVTAHDLGTFTGAVVTLRHSDDDSTFVDLLAFAAETLTRHAQRVTVAGAVRRYVAQSLDRTGAGSGGSITYLVGLTRN